MRSVRDFQSGSIEYYGEAGPLRHLLPSDRRNEVACLVWDGELGKVGINIGAGGFYKIFLPQPRIASVF
ncbi:MAG TPA: hypothetical protein VNR70_07330 [Steroidobacteraceae bacterium]|nr:hypothetical protein [Steroidobacteraceae bacterium]